MKEELYSKRALLEFCLEHEAQKRMERFPSIRNRKASETRIKGRAGK
jgi:hypothetical protein